MTQPGTSLPPGAVWLHPFGRDPNGRLFTLDGGIYRVMTAHGRPFYEGLLREAASRPGLRDRLVETSLSDLCNGAELPVLRHELLAPKLYPSEWSPEMFRDAALAHCELHAELARCGYGLQDAHPWNILFKGCEPRFADLGSIVPAYGAPLARGLLREYLDYMLYPLALMERGRAAKARRFLRVSGPPLELRDLLGHLGPLDGPLFLLRRARQALAARLGTGPMLAAVEAQVRAARIPKPRTQWTDYHSWEFAARPEDWHGKQTLARRLLAELRPATVLDAGCATGWYSLLAAEAGCRVIAADPDDTMVDEVYRQARARRLPVTPCVIDLFSAGREPERFRCDAVFATALVHHLTFTEQYDFDAVADVLSKLAGRWLMTEFIGPDDPFVKERLSPRFSHYTLENLAGALKKRFREVTAHPSTSKNRTLLACVK